MVLLKSAVVSLRGVAGSYAVCDLDVLQCAFLVLAWLVCIGSLLGNI